VKHGSLPPPSLGLKTTFIWEPACGDGAISKELEIHGHQVYSTDLIDRGYGEGGCDFLSPVTLTRVMLEQPCLHHVVTNPPYSYLHIAAAAYQKDVVIDLIARGADVAPSRSTTLPMDCLPRVHGTRRPHEAVVACLIEADTDPNAVDKSGVTPLQWADAWGLRERCQRWKEIASALAQVDLT
jgi:hypothetical protein